MKKLKKRRSNLNRLISKCNDEIIAKEGLIILLNNNLAAFGVLFILAFNSHKRIVDGISYYETLITEKDLQKLTKLSIDNMWDALDCLHKVYLISYCVVDKLMIFMLPCISEN